MNQVISVGPQESFLVGLWLFLLGQMVKAKIKKLKKINKQTNKKSIPKKSNNQVL